MRYRNNGAGERGAEPKRIDDSMADAHRYEVVLLTGDRGPADPVAAAAGVAAKALAPVAEVPLLRRALDNLAATGRFRRYTVVGPAAELCAQDPVIRSQTERPGVHWVAPAGGPSASAARALVTLPETTPVLLTTVDHALPRPGWIDEFMDAAARSEADLCVGVVAEAEVQAAYPESRRTAFAFADAAYCGCNLFALNTFRARRAVEFWQQMEQRRKRPWMMVRVLGAFKLLRYLTGGLSLRQALDAFGTRLGISIEPVLLSDPAAALDIDSAQDWKQANRWAQSAAPGPADAAPENPRRSANPERTSRESRATPGGAGKDTNTSPDPGFHLRRKKASGTPP